MDLWPSHVLGLDDASGAYYLWWSGFGARLTFLAVAVPVYRKHVCHVKPCWRIARHQVLGTPHRTCRRHHPEDTPSAQKVIDDYRGV